MINVFKELKNQEKRNILVVLSGPTCSGKDSVMKQLLKRNKNMQRLITTNSRPKRAYEKEAVDYYFINRQTFEKLIAQGAFFEWVEYRGHYRGSQKKHIKKALDSGKDVVWRIDVRGAKNVYKKVKREFPQSVFILLAEDLPVLKKRMIRRATENGQEKKWSLDMAAWELDQYKSFDYLVCNKEGKLTKTVELVESIIKAEKRKVFKRSQN